MAGLSSALQGLAKGLAQTTSFTGRVLDQAGNGLRGAQVRVILVNVDEDVKQKLIGLRNVKTDGDGKYTLATAPLPPEAERYRVRVEVTVEGHAKVHREFPLSELVKPGTQALRIPDLRLVIEDNE